MTAINRREAILAGAAAVLLPSVAKASAPVAGVESGTIAACWADCVAPTFIHLTITDGDDKVIFGSNVGCKYEGDGVYSCEVPCL